ncbi:MAG: ATP synthase subunit I [Halioglobus sp.]
MNGAEIKRPPIHRITIAQLAILMPLCMLLLSEDQVRAYSLLCGGLIAILPQAYFAARVFRRTGAQSAQAIARASYSGEIGKFALTAAGFAVVFAAVSPVDGLSVFIGYLIMLAIQITGSWLLLRM